MDLNAELHDANVLGMSFVPDSKALSFQLKRGQTRSVLLFEDTLFWTLSPFEEQNVLFELRTYASGQTPVELAGDFTEERWQELQHQGYGCHVLDSSVGLHGYVVARRVLLTQV